MFNLTVCDWSDVYRVSRQIFFIVLYLESVSPVSCPDLNVIIEKGATILIKTVKTILL